MFSLFNAIQIISVRILSGSDQVLFTRTDLLIAYLQKYSKYYYKYLCIYRYCSISVELRRWSGDGALFTRLDKYRVFFHTSNC